MVTPPGPVTVKDAALIVPCLIASLKVALSIWPIGTLVDPFAGTTAVTVGAAVIVVKLHT
jgi:hypothetical protein